MKKFSKINENKINESESIIRFFKFFNEAINYLLEKLEYAEKIKEFIMDSVKTRYELNDILLESEGELNDIINTLDDVLYI